MSDQNEDDQNNQGQDDEAGTTKEPDEKSPGPEPASGGTNPPCDKETEICP